LRRYKWKSVEVSAFQSLRFSKGMGHFEHRFQTEGGVARQPLLVLENNTDCPFVWYQNICSASFCFVTVHACDRRTDRQNCNSQDRASIAMLTL